MTLYDTAQTVGSTIVIDHGSIVSAAQWLGGAVLAIGGFFGFIFKWMMDRISRNQEAMTLAVESLNKAVNTFDRREADERAVHEKLSLSQDRIVQTQDRILQELTTRLKVTA